MTNLLKGVSKYEPKDDNDNIKEEHEFIVYNDQELEDQVNRVHSYMTSPPPSHITHNL